MSKIFKLLILFFLYFIVFNDLNALNNEDINIISRSEWWASEPFRYLDSEVWEKKISNWEKTPKKSLNDVEENIASIEAEKVKKANNYIIKNHSDIFWIDRISKVEDWHKLAWPNAYSKKKVAIVIHHTDSHIKEWDDNYDAMRDLYKYHSLSRGWWDIWYNFVIWTNWEIFEWRSWWDYVVWAHDKWNNQSTIWISLIWNFSHLPASDSQIKSLEKLTKYLIDKYDINLDKKIPFFKWCNWISEKCQENPLIINYEYPIIWHRDAWHTECPWDMLYQQMQDMKEKFLVWITSKEISFLESIESKLKNLNENSLLQMLSNIELLLDRNSIQNKSILIWIKNIILNIENDKYYKDNLDHDLNEVHHEDDWHNHENDIRVNFDDNNKIKIKLSYPFDDSISLKVDKTLSLNFIKDKQEYILDFSRLKKISKSSNYLKFSLVKNKLYIDNTLIIDFNKIDFLRIKVPDWDVIEINSWDRKPSWDITWTLNDNKFRWNIVLYTKNDKLVVVNDILLSDYLKWLWEVSDWTNKEKIRTIIILARTYARWYISKARKFAWEWYDGSDDPNVFQKYLWFWLEQRSEKINEIVEETKDLVVTYNWDLIKPWYFSSSDWETTSFMDFCKTSKWVPDCSHPEKFPFLIWVEDNWWIWKVKAWHWVWVPWTWVQYFSDRNWSFSMIIKYFLKWVQIQRKN